MIKSWNKFIFEKVRYNPTKIAANINPDPMGFTSPAFSDIRFKYCSVYFPDGAELSFDIVHERLNDTVCPIKLTVKSTAQVGPNVGNFPGSLVAKEYLNLYGSNLQFENHDEYRFVRMNLPNDEMFDTWFDGYIYNEEKLGFTEVKICIDSNNLKDINMYRTRDFGILSSYNADSIHVLRMAIHIVNRYPSWRNKFKDVLDDTYTPLSIFFSETCEDTELKSMVPFNIFVYPKSDGSFLVDDLAAFNLGRRYKIPTNSAEDDSINFLGLLYLFYIQNTFSDIVDKKFKYIFTHWNQPVPVNKISEIFDEIY